MLVEMMRDGGASMWAILAFDMCAMLLVPVALIVSIVARARGKMRGVSLTLGVLALLSALVPMCAGVGGYMFGMSKVEDAVENVSADQKAVIMAAGESEASANLNLGFGSGCTCLLPAVLALLLVPPKREAFDD